MINLRNPRGKRQFSNLITGPAQLPHSVGSHCVLETGTHVTVGKSLLSHQFPKLEKDILYGMCVRSADC